MIYKHQKEFLILNYKKILLAGDTGIGKTKMSIEWAKQNSFNFLVICPKALRPNWEREINKWWKNCRNYKVVTKEEFRRDWEALQKNDAVIVDEAHFFASVKSQMSKSLYKYNKKHNIENILLMTATPYISSPWNIYVLAQHLGYRWNYLKFKYTFFNEIRMGMRTIPQVKKGIEGRIATLVNKIGHVIKLEDCVDVPEQVFETEYFSLNKVQEKEKKNITETVPIVRFTKYHQIENGTIKGDEFVKDKIFSCDKIERIKILCDTNKKIAVICRYNLQIEAIAKELEKKVFIINGKSKNRDEIVKEVEKAEECVVLINGACSEGYELPSIGVIVFASLSFSYKNRKQMLGRFLRINKLKKNVYIDLITKGGVDEDVYSAIMNKRDFDFSIYNYDI